METETKELSLSNLIKDHKIEIPGFDQAKTCFFILILIIMLMLITDNPILKIIDFKELETNKDQHLLITCSRFSFLMIIISLSLCVFSMVCVFRISNIPVSQFNRCRFIFLPKLLINISLICFFMTISLWIFFLGGIINSPFASLLSMSPILMSIQIFRERKNHYNFLYKKIYSINQRIITLHKWNRLQKIVRFFGFLPILIIILTLVLGWINFDFIKKINDLQETNWFSALYHCIYYFSVLIAFVGVLPDEKTKNWTSKYLL